MSSYVSFAKRFPHRVHLEKRNESVECFKWLIDNVGLSNYSYMDGTYFFKIKDHAVLFALRWI